MTFRSLALSCFVLTFPAAAATPVILSLDPPSVIAGSSSFTLTINGANFQNGAQVRVNGSAQSTNFVSTSRVTATILSTFLANPTTLQVTVTNLGSSPSSAVALNVLPNNPQIDSLDPPSVPVGTQTVTVRVIGANFGSTASVRVNSLAHSTAFVSDSELTFTLSPSEISHTANLSVNVVNPANRLSNTVTLPVTSGATPSITLLSPNSVAAGSSSFTLTVIGSGFVNGSVIRVNGAPRPTSFVDGSHLTMSVQSSDVSKSVTLSISVMNPNNAVSSNETLTITNGSAPVIQSINPSSVVQGSAGFTLSVTGSRFISGARVFAGTPSRSTTVVDAQHLTAQIPATDIDTQGPVPITVSTSAGVSNAATLTVVSQSAPLVTSMTPNAVAAGSPAFKLLITGSKFESDDIVRFNGSALPTEFISATQIAATVAADQILTAGSAQITVARKDNSGTSAPLALTITSANAPAITSLSPPEANAGGGALTLAINGHNFATASVVTVDGSPRDTAFVNTTELHVAFTAAETASPRQYEIAVANPGGVISPSATFAVITPVPSIAALTPDTVISGAPAFLLTVTGAHFSSSSVINVDGTPHTTQLQSGALSTTVTAAEISGSGTLPITVSDHGATSAAASLKVLRPAISGLDPAVLFIGSLSAAVRVDGSAFLPTSKVLFNTFERATISNSDGSLTVTLNGGDLFTPGDFSINVRNSPISLSPPVTLSVISPGTPQISTALPITVGAATLTVDGAHFVPLSIIHVNGIDRSTTYLGSTQLRAQLEVADTAVAGTLLVTVRNPDGAVSNAAVVQVNPPPVFPPRRRGARH